MKKYVVTILLSLLVIFPVHALELVSTNSKTMVVYDLTSKEVRFDRGGETKKSIASLTKIATALTAIQTLEEESISLDTKVTITQENLNDVNYELAKCGLKVGDEVTYRDLLYAMLLPSAADAAIALVENISNTEENFVTKMNTLARNLSLENTHFANVTGLDNEENYSTGMDVLKLTIAAFNNDTFKEIFITKEYTLSNGLTVRRSLEEYNNYVDSSRILGAKTGYTANAGRCLVAYFVSNNHEYITVSLGADTQMEEAYHIKDTLNVIEELDAQIKEQVLLPKDSIVATIQVEDASMKEYQVKSDEITYYLPNDYNKSLLTYSYQGTTSIDGFYNTSNKLGTVSYYYNEELIHTQDVYVTEELHPSILGYLKAIIEAIIMLGVLYVMVVGAFKTLQNSKFMRK